VVVISFISSICFPGCCPDDSRMAGHGHPHRRSIRGMGS
jgi:hypothetical protein